MLRQQVWANGSARALMRAMALTSMLVACGGDDSQSPATGIVEGTVTTSGDNQDSDGYTVTVNGQSVTVAANATARLTGIPAGPHTVGLGGIANNCAVADANPQSVTVSAGQVTRASFAVTCVAVDPAVQTGTIEVTVATTGSNLDADGYLVSVDGGPEQVIGTDGTMTVANVVTGARSVALSGIASNCTVADNPRGVTVAAGATASLTFQVTCGASATTGSIRATVATSGADLDPDGYTVSVDGGTPQAVPATGEVTFTNIAAGTRSVQLSGVAANCTVTGANPRPVDVAAGATAAVAFEVTCAAPPPPPPTGSRILFLSTRDDPKTEIYSANPDGSDVRRLTTNSASEGDASWSPDYTKIVFSSDRDGDFDVYVMNADGTGTQQLTNSPRDDGFAVWSPDGTKIAFTSDRGPSTDVYVMNADGSGVVEVSKGANAVDNLPGWSPDGSKIVFASSRSGNFELHEVNADGTGVQRLTTSPGFDQTPAYSPDGTKIVFASGRDDASGDIYVMNADGSGTATRLTTEAGADEWPRWSPDGTQIIFQSRRGGSRKLYRMSATDGSGVTPVAAGAGEDIRPAWRP
jgi:WD40 repeat protein